MKNTLYKLMGITLLSLFLISGIVQKMRAQDATVSYQTFYDELSPYGQWVTDPQYGNVWVPNEGGDFRPYGTRGHWVMTDYGNTWVSDDSWGWACYHYGRWTYDPYYGWVWVPGYEWAPAWVNWRFGGGYCGWAPLGPGVGLTYNCPNSWWVFIEPRYMYAPDCFHYWRGPAYNRDYIRQTAIINNYYRDNSTQVRYNYGPRAADIQAVTHQPVQVYHVSQNNRPGASGVRGNNLNIYRPAVNKATISSARPRNAIAAPRAIGAPHENATLNAAKQPAFRQQVQSGRVNPGNTVHANQPRQTPQAQQQKTQPRTQPHQRPQPQPQQRPQPQPQQRPQPMPHAAPPQHEEPPHERRR